MMMIIPYMIWSALSLSCYSGLFVVLMQNTMNKDLTDNEKTSKAMLAMIGLGIGEFIGGFIQGYF